jgi:hypothetical protein
MNFDAIIAQIEANGRSCRGCDLCCEALGVNEMPDKPAGVRCPLQMAPGLGCGCTKYAERPKSCQEFYCLWRATQYIPDAWHPMKVGFVVAVSDPHGSPMVLTVHVDPKRPDAWKAQQRGLRNLAIDLKAIVVVGGGTEGHTIFSPAGKTYSRAQYPQLFVGAQVAIPSHDMPGRGTRPMRQVKLGYRR